MTKRNINGLEFYSTYVPKRSFLSWANVWLGAQVLFLMNALMWSVGKPVSLLVAAGTVVWMIHVTQKI